MASAPPMPDAPVGEPDEPEVPALPGEPKPPPMSDPIVMPAKAENQL